MDREELRHRVEAKASRQPIQRAFFIGNRVGLQFHLHLETVLDLAQESIGIGQRRGVLRRERFRPDQGRQRPQGATVAQLRQSRSPQHLEGLHNEFNFADAADAEFHMARELSFAHHFLLNAFLQDAYLLNDVAAGVARVGKVLNHPGERGPNGGIARDGPRLDQRHPFPRFAKLGVVILATIERTNQRAGLAFGPQPQINSEDVPFRA